MTRGDLPERDIDDQAPSYAEVKALATGDPLILEKAGVDNDVARLRRLERAHQDDQHRLRRALDAARHRAARCTVLVERLDAARHRAARCTVLVERLDATIAQRRDTRGDRFSLQVDGVRYDKRTEAGAQLRITLLRTIKAAPGSALGPAVRVVGELAGFPLTATPDRRTDDVTLSLGNGVVEVTLSATEVANSDPVGLVQRLERRLAGLEDARSAAIAEVGGGSERGGAC